MPAVSTKARFFGHARLIGAIATIAAGGMVILAGSATSQSVTPQGVDPLQHFIDCAGVLISAPDVHAANCLPNNIPPEMKSLASPTEDKPLSDCIIQPVTFPLDGDSEGEPCPDDSGDSFTGT